MNDIVIDTLIEKVTAQENRLNEQQKISNEMNETISLMKTESEHIQRMLATTNELQISLKKLTLPVTEMEKLKNVIALNNHLLEHPIKQKVLHVHTGGKVLLICIAELVIIILIAIGWIDTGSSLKRYKMHDTCWRYLKLQLDTKGLKSLQNIERQYQQDASEMSGMVDEQELQVRLRAEAHLR
jgi:hypothetical protein